MMRLPSREGLLRLGRFVLIVEGIALAVAAILAAVVAVATRSLFGPLFQLFVFLLFLLFLVYGALSGPGLFLAKPKFVPLDTSVTGRWPRWLSTPPIVKDQEYYELLLYIGLGFLLLILATGISAVLRALTSP